MADRKQKGTGTLMGKTRVTRIKRGAYSTGYDAGGGGSAVAQAFGTLIIDDVIRMPTGFNSIHSLVYANGYVFGVCSTAPGIIFRFNTPDVSLVNVSSYTLANDGNNNFPTSIAYVKSINRIVLGTTNFSNLINIHTYLADAAFTDQGVLHTITPSSAIPNSPIVAGSKLFGLHYVCIPATTTRIERYTPAGVINTASNISLKYAECMVVLSDEGATVEEAFISGTDTTVNPNTAWVHRRGAGVRAFTLHGSTTFSTPDIRFFENSIGGIENENAGFPAYIGFRGPVSTNHAPGPSDYVVKMTNPTGLAPDFTTTHIPIISQDANPRQCTGIWGFPPYVYATTANGYSAIVRINPSTDGATEYAFPLTAHDPYNGVDVNLQDASSLAVDPAGNIYVSFLLPQPGVVVRCRLT